MLNENAKKWVAALRSGKYSQTRGVLHREGNGYCCLGVGCEVYIQSGGKLKKEVRIDNYPDGRVFYDDNAKLLPEEVRLWLGLASANGIHNQRDENEDSISLAKLNDNGQGFEAIADIIESEPYGLFKAKGG